MTTHPCQGTRPDGSPCSRNVTNQTGDLWLCHGHVGQAGAILAAQQAPLPPLANDPETLLEQLAEADAAYHEALDRRRRVLEAAVQQCSNRKVAKVLHVSAPAVVAFKRRRGLIGTRTTTSA